MQPPWRLQRQPSGPVSPPCGALSSSSRRPHGTPSLPPRERSSEHSRTWYVVLTASPLLNHGLIGVSPLGGRGQHVPYKKVCFLYFWQGV